MRHISMINRRMDLNHHRGRDGCLGTYLPLL
nr:MAG TPA: hypothetical protein [Caudoviricetes sp.]